MDAPGCMLMFSFGLLTLIVAGVNKHEMRHKNSLCQNDNMQ